MLKRWTALLLAVMLIFLTACGAQKEYKLSAVFAAAEEDRRSEEHTSELQSHA